MANGIYFDLYRDDTSDSTSSPDESQQLSIVLDQDRQSASSSSIYSVIGKAFGALKLQGSGMFRYNNTDTESNLNDPTPILRTPDVRVFSLAELKNATKNFKSDRVLDEGVYGKVFKGLIDDKNHPNCSREYFVAIKKLNSKSIQGTGGCQYEVNSFGRHYHKNIVRLLGYCLEDKELLLVYEFMPKGSFENHLFRNVQLAWNLRIKIVLGAARGLAFLHSVDKTVIYREFRTSNILLDGDYNAKLSDFGLAKNDPLLGYSHLTTPVMGTYGYAAPEYVAKGHLCVKSDVYGFGVVLLEVLTGLRAVDTNRPTGQHNLVDWLKPSLSYRRKLPGIMDPTLKNQCSAQAATQAATLTLKCLSTKPGLRPSMEEVVQCLEGIQLM